jgi:hypothetical protein
LSLPLLVFAQSPKPTRPTFDIVDFNKKFEVVQWLVAYDTIARRTTDLLLASDKAELARLGREWFCFQDSNGVWHAVYGKLSGNQFDLVFHYVVDGTGKISRTTTDRVDENFLVSHAKALALAQSMLAETIPQGSPRHNNYIKLNQDKTFTVWHD